MLLPSYPFEKRRFTRLLEDFEAGKGRVFNSLFAPNQSRSPLPVNPGGKGEYPEEAHHPGETNETNPDRSVWLSERPTLTTEYIAPRNDIERKLSHIWNNFFGIDNIGIDDDLFELGGDSLKAINLISIIHKEFNVSFPIEDFFKGSNIRSAARYITGAETRNLDEISPVEDREYYPLSSTQHRLFLLQQMDNSSIAYNLPQAVLLEGDISPRKIKETFHAFIRRHEVLRSALIPIGDDVVQKVFKLPEISFKLEYHETLPDSPSTAQSVREFIRPFDLTRATPDQGRFN